MTNIQHPMDTTIWQPTDEDLASWGMTREQWNALPPNNDPGTPLPSLTEVYDRLNYVEERVEHLEGGR